MNHSQIARVLLSLVLVVFVATVIVSAVRMSGTIKNPPPPAPAQNALNVQPLTPEHEPFVTLVASSSATTWNTYRDELMGYSYVYPSSVAPAHTRYGNCFTRGQENFCVEARTVGKGVTLDDLFNAKESNWVNENYGGMIKEKVTVAGHDAYLLRKDRPSEYGYPETALLVMGEHYVLDMWGERIPQELLASVTFFPPSIDLRPYALNVIWSKGPPLVIETREERAGRYCAEPNGHIVGTVNNGVFKGDRIIAKIASECGMDCGGRSEDELVYHIYHGDRVIPVGNASGFTVTVVQTPDVIAIPNSSYVLKKDFASGVFDKEGTTKTLFTDPVVGNIYETSYYRSCIVAKRQDHALVYYSLQLPFMNKENGVVDLTLSNGKNFNESYDVDSDWSCLPVVQKPNGLYEVARNSLGEPFFALAPVEPKLKVLYEDKNTMAAYQKLTPSYDEFLALNPFLYWQDPFGRWIEMKNKKYVQAAEKCKPVIYLYPEKEMDVSVYVAPNGGFTHTIPEYNNGWHVTAHPDGTIIDKLSKQTYPYLYWAGWSIDTPAITKGWVVARGDIPRFLVDKLTLLGLNAKEIADFNEYWVAKLAEDNAPYHKIMFLDQEEFNLMAPLRVVGEKRPDQIIRVVMYAQATARKETLPVQVLPETPSRDGFTVVEWGGSLLK